MNRLISFLILTVSFVHLSYAQNDSGKKETLSPEATRQLLNSIKPDSAKILRDYSLKACHCIDSLLGVLKADDTVSVNRQVSACIDEQVFGYQLIMKMNRALGASNDADKNIALSTDKNTNEYKAYYRDIEEWLADSCSALRVVMMNGNLGNVSELSFSNDPEALRQYNEGVNLLAKEDYAGALTYFRKAVQIDPKFAFAWDNVGICSRRTGDLDNALIAYNKSLELIPNGKTPLQNIPVVYEIKKDYTKAIDAYKKLLTYYPEDAEAYYGMGRIGIIYTDDLEAGTDYMCKAYNIYVKTLSPYRSDAQTNLSVAYRKMKEKGKEDVFFRILKDNNISTK